MERRTGLDGQCVVLLDGQDLAGVVAGPWAEEHLHPEPLRAIHWHPVTGRHNSSAISKPSAVCQHDEKVYAAGQMLLPWPGGAIGSQQRAILYAYWHRVGWILAVACRVG